MSQYLLGIAAVNLYTVFSQSDNISMFRGASLTLREAAKLSQRFIASLPFEVKPVSVGASEGFYLINADESQVSHLVETVKGMLNTDYPGYTFVCDMLLLPSEKDFLKIQTRLKNKMRSHQQRQTRVSLSAGQSDEVCSLTHLLAADDTYYSKKGSSTKKTGAAEAVARFNKGRDDKQAFYRQELSQQQHEFVLEREFTNDLQMLSGAGDTGDAFGYRRLRGKLAYIYLDGNKFTDIQRQVVHDIESQITFDHQLQALRADLLAAVLDKCQSDEEWLAVNKDKSVIRLETLLWGGDEILFVVPAWKAFDFVAQLEELTRDWCIQSNGNTYPLTHGFGMLLCKHSMPVYRMRQLAQMIADEQKNKLKCKQQNDNSLVNGIAGIGNVFDSLVLESEDFAENSVTEHFQHRYGPLFVARKASMPSLFTSGKLQHVREQLKKLSRSQIYLLAAAGMAQNSTFTKQEERFVVVQETVTKAQFDALTCNLAEMLLGFTEPELYPTNTSETKKLEEADNKRALTWVVLTECIEYLLPEKEVKV